MNSSTHLYRQINPRFIKPDGTVNSQAFNPMNHSNLSVYNGDLTTPEKAYRHYTEELGNNSGGVKCVTCKDCTDLDLEPKEDPDPFPEHAIIDFPGIESKSAKKRIAQELRDKSRKYGWPYRPKI